MNGTKILVFVMTGMLVFLFGVLLVGLLLGWHLDDVTDPVGGVTHRDSPFDELVLGQPVGTIIEDIDDISGLMAITLSGGGLPPRIILVDPSTGQIIGIVEVTPHTILKPSP